SGLFKRSVIEGLCTWWSGTRVAGEGLPAFLVRNGVFLSFTIEELELIEKNYVRFSSIHPFFAPGGVHRLQEKSALAAPTSGAEDTHVFQNGIQETLHPSHNESSPQREEPTLPATESVKVIAAAQPSIGATAAAASPESDIVAGTKVGACTL